MKRSRSLSGQHVRVLDFACATHRWDVQKLVLCHRQGKDLGVLSDSALKRFVHLGIIEPRDGQLAVCPVYEPLVSGLTVMGLSKLYPRHAPASPSPCNTRNSVVPPAPPSGIQLRTVLANAERRTLRFV